MYSNIKFSNRTRSRKPYACLIGFVVVITILVILTMLWIYHRNRRIETQVWKNPRLSANVRPVHYDLTWFPDFYEPESAVFNGTVSIETLITWETDVVYLHSNRLNITNIEVEVVGQRRRTISIKKWFLFPENEYLVIQLGRTLKQDSTVFISIEFSGRLDYGIDGFYKAFYKNTQTKEINYLVTTKFEPTDARTAVPCFDEPNMRATFTVHLVHKANYVALSNMPNISTVAFDGNENFVVTSFAKSVSMATYLLCVAIGDFEYKETRAESGVQIRIYSTPDKISQVDYALNITPRILDKFAHYFGIEFPLPKLDQIALPIFESAAMEHWGLVSYRESFLLFDEKEASPANKQRIATVIAHELAHMWFGNLVTMKWWNDLWLNEGFASYVEYLGVDHVAPDWDIFSQFINMEMEPVMKSDSLINSRPIVVPMENPDSIQAAFDSITYNKGATILRMLCSMMGMDRFIEGLRRYMIKYKFQNAVTQDLWDTLAQEWIHKSPISDVMDTWILQMGFPVIYVTRDSRDSDVIRLEQKRFLMTPNTEDKQAISPFKYIWNIHLEWRSLKNSSISGTLWLQNKTDTYNLGTDDIYLNVNRNTLAIIDYTQGTWLTIENIICSKNPRNSLSTMEIIAVLDDTLRLSEVGRRSYESSLKLLQCASRIHDESVWSTFSYKLAEYPDLLDNADEGYQLLKKFMIEILKQPVEYVYSKIDLSHNDELFRKLVTDLAVKYEFPLIMDKVEEIKNKTGDVPPSLRAIYYAYSESSTSTSGRASLWDKYLNTSVPQQRLVFLYALCQTNDSDQILQMLDDAKNDSIIGSQDFLSLIYSLSTGHFRRQITWQWTQQNWEFLVKRYTLNNLTLAKMILALVSKFKTEEQLKEVKDFYSKFSDAGAGHKIRLKSLERIEFNIWWLRNRKDDFLSSLKTLTN